jgi:hypothetical protein
MTFKTDLKLGVQYEKLYASMIEYDTCEMAEGVFKPWDLKIIRNGETTTYEVKADRMAKATGNLVIEYECSGKPSGITSSLADYWVYFIVGTTQYYRIPRTVIMEAIQAKKYKRTVRGGDSYKSNMYLFRIEDFNEWRNDVPDTC